ncbi:uncharacterized protein LOC103575851 [Microplitis demolitor]|uniref:uncharacterized protein LOC103575851 n=1 Tax=Microplitis demolitor TaxID=69319 RepID=UPI0004CD9DB6|nr:uncharacterized protein LOC103575851 [Microplitis demolitor]
MDNLENLQLQLYIVCGVVACCLVLILTLIIVLFIKVNDLSRNRNGTNRDLDTDFCYSNPAIVPGEELSRRGYSIYRAPENPIISQSNIKNKYGNSRESLSRF